MSYGPNPWQQTNWDWRAAGNFVCGGAGGGLIVFAALSGAQGLALTVLLLGGMALVGTGLLCVWLELGRPLRALHVFFNPRTSWMTREAFAATLLIPVSLDRKSVV
jgi:phenylacetyl-CoA:acceptor oxidoreductase subunit 2